MQIERHTPGGENHAQKEGGAPPCENAPHGTTDTTNSTKSTDPLAGWHDLAKPAREQRRSKRSWRRTGGTISPDLLASLLILAVAALLLVWGA